MTEPNNRELLLWAAWFQAALDRPAEAERLLAQVQAQTDDPAADFDPEIGKVWLRLHRYKEVLAKSVTFLQTKPPLWEEIHMEMRFSPLLDGLRGDPQFEKLLRDNLPEGAKPFAAEPGQ